MDHTGRQAIPSPLTITLERAIDLAQQLAIDELRLFQYELHDRVSEALRRGAWVGFGALSLVAAWGAACAAAVLALEAWLPLAARLALLALSQSALGVLLVRLAWRERPEER